MKKRVLRLFLCVGLMSLGLTACNTTGTVGPQGPKGDTGEIGPQGPAGVDGQDGKDGIDGKDGQDGKDGEDGKDGVDGLPGADGATWLTGETDPSNEIGSDGDLFLNTSTYDIFVKTAGNWNKIGNIKGANGQNGQDGNDGQDGKDGAKGQDGTDGKDGKDGQDGQDGKDGKDGVDGLPGADGATWHTGSENPTDSLGNNGDLFLNTTTYDLFLKSNDSWSKIGNIKGADGVDGNDGNDAETYGITFTISFDTLGGSLIDSEETIEAKYGETIDLPIAEKDGFIFKGWYTGFGVNDGKFTSVTPVTRDLTLYAGWEAEQLYSIYFHSNGGSTVQTLQFQNNDSVVTLPTPSKTDFVFYGWYYDEGLSDRVSYPFIINKDLDMYASWVDAYYEISFNTVGGVDLENESYLAGTEITELPSPTKQYMSFAGWYLDSGYRTPVTLPFNIHANTTLYAKWNSTNSTITFYSNGGSDVSNKTVTTGTYIAESSMPKPTREGYTFAGWYTNSSLTSAVAYPYLVTGNTTLFAKWTDNYAGYTKISTFNQLKSLSMSGRYVLTSDIDCGGSNLPQIGTTSSPFNGTFDGAGHTISNFVTTSNASESNSFGFFGVNNGSILNLKLNGSYTTSHPNQTADRNIQFGGLVGLNNGTVAQCSVSSNLSFTSPGYYSNGTYTVRVGGVVGKNSASGQVNNVIFKGVLTSVNNGGSVTSGSNQYTCGVVGQNVGTISNVVFAGTMSASAPNGSTGSTATSTYMSGITIGGTTNNALVVTDFSGSTVKYSSTVAYSGTLNNCYYCTNLTNYGNGKTKTTTGSSCSTSSLNSSSYYINTLKFSSSVWKTTGLSYSTGVYVDLL